MKIRWNEIDRVEWDRRIAAGARGGVAPLQQDWRYGEASRLLGGETLRAAVELDGAPVALAQFAARRIGFGGRTLAALALCSRGPLWLHTPSESTKAEVYRVLKNGAPLGRRRIVLFSPDEERPGEGVVQARLRRVMTGYSTAVLDLSRDLDALRAGMQGKWRNRLNAAEREGLKVTVSQPRPGRLDWLLARDEAQQKRNGYRALPSAFVEAYQIAAGRRGLRLFRADREGRPVAAMLFLIHGGAATYQIGWSDEDGRRLGAHNALLWRAAAALKSDGLSQLDLGGVDTERGAGIARFKLGCGARPMTLCGTYL